MCFFMPEQDQRQGGQGGGGRGGAHKTARNNNSDGNSGGRGGGEFTLNRRFHTAADVCKEGSDDVGAVLYKAVDWVHLPRKGDQKEPALTMAVAVRAASRRLRGGLVQRMVTFVER